MSLAAICQVFSMQVGNSNAKIVLLCIAEHVRDGNIQGATTSGWPAISKIASRCEISERSVQRAIRYLEDKGLIEAESRKREDGSTTSNNYRLLFDVKSLKNKAGLSDGVGRQSVGGGCHTVRGGVTHSQGGGDTQSPLEPVIEPVKEPKNQKLALDGLETKQKAITKIERMILDVYDKDRGNLQKVVERRWPGSKGSNDLKARIKEDDEHHRPEFWSDFFKAARDNPTWNGDNSRGWRASLAWLSNRSNFDKVVQRWANTEL